MNESRMFYIERKLDVTGISGVGRVLDGVVFHTGQVVVCWRSEHSSITVFPSWDAFDAVHLRAHPENRAQIMFIDGGVLPSTTSGHLQEGGK